MRAGTPRSASTSGVPSPDRRPELGPWLAPTGRKDARPRSPPPQPNRTCVSKRSAQAERSCAALRLSKADRTNAPMRGHDWLGERTALAFVDRFAAAVGVSGEGLGRASRTPSRPIEDHNM